MAFLARLVATVGLVALIGLSLRQPSYSSSGVRAAPTLTYAGSKEWAVSVTVGSLILIGIWRRVD
jgi:hypothetical protein